ncbi:MAG: methyltransferase [Lentisphaerales bacterium]|jgi:predicted O-methyltransferase YrrM|nr:MAG: methyltransferase [Lentisphaerales bacterium]
METRKNSNPRPDPSRIIDMASAFYESCILFTASDLDIFGLLARTGAATASDVADTLHLDRRATRLLLDGCCAIGLLRKDQNVYTNTDESAALLVPGSPMDLSKAIRYNRDVYNAWGKLPSFLKTGEPVERPEIHLGEDKKRTRDFVLAMHGRALGIGRAVIHLLDLKGARRILDIGGGSGAYSMLVAEANPHVECVMLDLPGIVDVACDLISGAGLQDRVSCVRGDYHVAELPSGFDTVNIFGVLHQEEPDSIRDILSRSFAALNPGGVIHVLDMMTDATHCQPPFSALFAVNMALTTENGWVFSDVELKAWMEESGYVDFTCRPLPPPMPHWLASARKPA